MSCGPSGVSRLASLRTAVFSPDNEKFASARPSIGRGKANRVASPRLAARSTSGPPGWGSEGDLRHNAAEAGLLVGLRAHDIGQNPAAAVALAFDHGGCGFIAGGLDPQYQHRLVVIQRVPLCYPSSQRFPVSVPLRGLEVQSSGRTKIAFAET